ncbi:uroporphyrinogen-III C-methyltransferase [Compostibacter hankyongensis]|uniref:uroporphyrinogen-III C-methyltransferase n=1 Tax=Compostibacter hankyongensis TaxID=1007089 RepID=A0ABP8FY80_9BACT
MSALTYRAVTPRLTLVGAGPGDPDLITLKGLKALREARVVLYDALIHPALLKEVSASALKRFVGKRAGLHTYSQDEINEMIVRYALAYGHVVRLKGGDPFVFGRGYEEIAYAESFNIETDVVPGISSAIALPELNKIPLTTRGVNESFWVLTGTNSEGKVSADVYQAAKTNATVVILMGLRKLGEIVEIFREAGKAELPVGIIANGSLPEEQFVLGKISDITEKAKQIPAKSPATLVIGEAVSLHLNARALHKQVKEWMEVL